MMLLLKSKSKSYYKPTFFLHLALHSRLLLNLYRVIKALVHCGVAVTDQRNKDVTFIRSCCFLGLKWLTYPDRSSENTTKPYRESLPAKLEDDVHSTTS